MSTVETTWVRVSRLEPCPICGRPDYCTRTTDGTAVKCQRVESDKPYTGKLGGWIHKMADPLPPLSPTTKKVEKKPDWTVECRKMFEHDKAHQKRCEVADLLKVSVESLEALRVGIGWDNWNGREFSSWPSRDNNGLCIGYVRRYDDGTKRTNQGGTTGVFYVPTWYTHPGPVFIVEGGSDVAACESNNLNSIGRASNTYGGHWIKKMIRQCCPNKLIVVVGERDEKPDKRGTVSSCTINCRGCAFCWPGLFGMNKVAAELGRRAVGVLVPPGTKDMRELLIKGYFWHDLLRAL